MLIRISILVVIMFFISCQKGKEYDYYNDSGKIKREYYKNNERQIDGKVIMYYKNGNIKEIKEYDKGKQVGDEKKFYENGVLKSQRYLSSTDSLYSQIEYYQNGIVKQAVFYDYDSVFNYSIQYDSMGLIKNIDRGLEVISDYDVYYPGNDYDLLLRLLGPIKNVDSVKLAFITYEKCNEEFMQEKVPLTIGERSGKGLWEIVYKPRSYCDSLMAVSYLCDNDTVLDFLSFPLDTVDSPANNGMHQK